MKTLMLLFVSIVALTAVAPFLTAEPNSMAIQPNHLAANQPFQAGLTDSILVAYTGSAIWSWNQDVEVVGNYAYCASYYGLMILNIANPANPTIVSQLYFPGWSVYHPVLGGSERDIDVAGNYAYMTSPCEGLKIIDISDPNDPILAGYYDDPDSCETYWDMVVSGGYVYAAAESGLEILDVTSPSNPHPVANFPIPYAYTIAISGNLVYLGGWQSLDVVDISDPLQPQSIISYPIACVEIQIKDSHAYIAGVDSQLIVADISTPSTPQFIDTTFCSNGLRSASMSGSYLYVGVGVMNPEGFGRSYDTLEIYSLDNPASPSLVTKYGVPPIAGVNISITGTRAYLTGWDAIAILDVANPAAPSLLGSYGPQVAQTIAAANGYAFLPGKDTLYVLDVSVPSNPIIAGQCFLGASADSWRITVSGKYAYVYGRGPGMRIVNILNPNAPVVEGQYACEFGEIAVQGTFVYGVNGDTMKIVDVSDAVSPSEVGLLHWGNEWTFTGLIVRDDYAYISINSQMVEPEHKVGLYISNIADPASPESTGTVYDTITGMFGGGDIEILDTFAYIPGCTHVITIADPAQPTSISDSYMPNALVPLTLAGSMLVSPAGYYFPAWLIADITDRAHPSSTQYNTIGFPTDAAYSGGYAYMMETVGMTIRRISHYSTGGRYIVTSLNNTGPGSLREAIETANVQSGIDTITFMVSGTISLTSPLPALIDDSTVILGSSALGGAWSVLLDGSGISGGGDGLVVQSRDNVIEGLTIKNFPGNSITVSGVLSVRNRLTRNLIYNNNGLAIDLGADGVTPNDLNDVDTGPNDFLNYPVVDTMYDGMNGKFYLNGHAGDSAVVEFYIAHAAGQAATPEDPSGHGEAYIYIGSDTCDSDGIFGYAVTNSFGNFSKVSMIAIDTLGNTSEFSENYTLIPAPLIVVAYSPVNIIITDPDGLQFGKDSLNNDITGIPDGHYFITPNDSVVIDHPKPGDYTIGFVTEAGTPPGATYSAIIKIDGTDNATLVANGLVPSSGQMANFDYGVEEGYQYINADANRDGIINIGDAVFIISYVFRGGPAPDPVYAADANCDRVVNVGDAVYIVGYMFRGGPEPCAFEP